jgi:hypothetical protein
MPCQVDKVRHGVNLLGRDTLVLSRVVATLGTFVECSAGSEAALPVARAVLELIASPEVGGWGRAACVHVLVCRCVPPVLLLGVSDNGISLRGLWQQHQVCVCVQISGSSSWDEAGLVVDALACYYPGARSL